MLIIDRNTDYYDYVSKLYGEDPQIVFDRRDSTILHANIDLYTNPTNKAEYFYTLLEVGLTQYLLKGINIHRDKETERPTSCDLKLIRIYNDQKNYFNHPLSIQQVRTNYVFGVDSDQLILNNSLTEALTSISELLPSPILKHTDITKFIEPTTIWNELQNYISSLNNDRDTDVPMTQEERAELHGFDRKTSFRHPVK